MSIEFTRSHIAWNIYNVNSGLNNCDTEIAVLYNDNKSS